jgi:hypothetical protein
MENNDSPYVYEKPLRAKGAKFTKAVTAAGLVAFGTVIGGGAFANSVESEADPQTPQPIIASGNDSNPNDAISSQVESASDSDSGLNAAIIAVPLEKLTATKNSAAIELPGLTNKSYGNTSSATPSAGGSQSGSNITSYQDFEDEDEDEYEDGERHDRDDHDHDDEDEEYED